jgi:hypothetical protein
VGNSDSPIFYREGNVGIGSTSPEEKLHVEGSLLLDVYNTDGGENGIFFRQGFNNANKYNLSILAYDHNNGGVSPDGLAFAGYDGVSFSTGSNSRNERMRINSAGNVGIGKTDPQYKLDVAGTIRATEIKVEAKTADFVFEEDYPLKPLDEVEAFVRKKKHLPEIPSAKEMEKEGVNVAQMNKLLLQKIEEMTLYMIQQSKRIEDLEEKNSELKVVKEELNVLKEKILKL